MYHSQDTINYLFWLVKEPNRPYFVHKIKQIVAELLWKTMTRYLRTDGILVYEVKFMV